jgi:hypothetical protein
VGNNFFHEENFSVTPSDIDRRNIGWLKVFEALDVTSHDFTRNQIPQRILMTSMAYNLERPHPRRMQP